MKKCAFANTQTVMLVYITIPARASFSSRLTLADGSINPTKNDMRDLLERYTIREVSLVCPFHVVLLVLADLSDPIQRCEKKGLRPRAVELLIRVNLAEKVRMMR